METPNATKVRLGGLLMADGSEVAQPEGAAFWFTVDGEDFTTGDPVPVLTVIRSMLLDGSLVANTRDENREASLRVRAYAPDSRAMADALRALQAEVGKRNEFGVTPPDGGPESVFDVLASSLTQVTDDLAWRRGELAFVLTMTCAPFVRPAFLVTVPAVVTTVPVGPPSVVVIDDCSSAAAWSMPWGTLTDVGTYLRASDTLDPHVKWTGSVDLSVRRFVTIEATTFWPQSLFINGIKCGRPVAVIGTTRGTALTWQVPSGVSTATTIEYTTKVPNYKTTVGIYSLRASDQAPYSSTARQSRRSVEVAGSARTDGSIQIAHPTSGLADTILYTWNGGTALTPSMRPYFLTGTTPVIDASKTSGATQQIATPTVYEIPANQLPAGKYHVVANMALSSSSPTTVTAQVYILGVAVGEVWSLTHPTKGTAATYRVVPLGSIPLPPADLPDETGATVRISISNAGDGAILDELWLFNGDIGALTIVQAVGHKRVWLDTANLDRPHPAAFVGDAADRSDAYGEGGRVIAWGVHEFVPPQTNTLIVTCGALAAEASFTYYPRDHYLTGDVD